MNEVDNLLKTDFLSLKFDEQLQIKKMGPHRPRTFEHTQTDKSQNRCFSSAWFDKVEWLTVSLSNKTFYCFYCLLFGGGDTPWCKGGYRDLKHLSERMKKHESSIVHINNAVRFKTFGVHKTPSGHDVSIYSHNEMVRKNRQVLGTIITCIKFCGSHGLPICGHRIKGDVFFELASYIARFDSTTDGHNTKKQHTPQATLDELLDCIYDVYNEDLTCDVINANFVALQVAEITGVPNKSQFALIFRFLKNGAVVERLQSFLKPPHVTPNGLSSVLKNVLKSYNIGPSKLIAQTYDSSTVMCDVKKGIQTHISESCPRAQFVPCCGYEFSSIFNKICSRIKSIKMFFVNISAFASFFKAPSPQHELLRKERDRSRGIDISWKFRQDVISNIYENQVEILTSLEQIQSKFVWNDDLLHGAGKLTKLLNDKEFFFFLDFFYNVLHHVDVLFNSLEMRLGYEEGTNALQEFQSEMATIRDNIDMVEETEIYESDSDEADTKNRRLKKNPGTVTELKFAAYDAWNVIITYVKELFEGTLHTVAFSVVDPKQFKSFKANFPNDHIDILTSTYPILNKQALVNELGVIYANETFAAAASASDLLKLLINSDLLYTFTQVCKLLEIVLVTPVNTVEGEMGFNTLKRMRAFLQRSENNEKLNALSVIALHRDVIEGISGFNNMVIDRFATKEHRTQYLYK